MTDPHLFAPLAAEPSAAAFLTDFDGTLAPIVDLPSRARALPAALAALRVLAARLAVVGVISGRPLDFLREHVPVPGVALVGHYGLERFVDGRVLVDDRAAGYVDAVAAAADEAERRWPTLLIERKGTLGVAVHWRTTPDAAPDPGALDALSRRYGLVLVPGRMSAEVRVPVRVDKGDAVRDLVSDHDVRVGAFAGDDRGDLPAFATLAELVDEHRGFVAIRVAVRSREAPPELLAAADQVIDSPAALTAALTDLAATLTERG